MASRVTAARPMECTGGFKALRNHVKLSKDDGSGVEKSAPPAAAQTQQPTEREQEWDETKQLQPLECHSEVAVRPNQERMGQEEHNLHLIRLSLAKEQRDVKTRERSVKAMETALQDAMDRTADKEKSLDQRIQDIARLEQRLHDALTQKTAPAAAPDPQQEVSSTNQINQAFGEMRYQLKEHETSLALREQELAMARDRVADRERHLSTKERVLRDKAVELNHLQTEIEKKDSQRAALVTQRLAELDQELKRRYEAQEQELVERFQQQLTALSAEFEVKHAQLHEHTTAAKTESQDRAARLVEREEALREAEAALASTEVGLNCQREVLLVAEQAAKTAIEDAANRAAALDTQRSELAERIEEAQATKLRYEEAHATLTKQEAKLALFAAEVEAQAQYNATQRQQLEHDRATFATRAVEEPSASINASESVAGPETHTETPPGARESSKPTRTRSFTSGLFRSKSTMRA